MKQSKQPQNHHQSAPVDIEKNSNIHINYKPFSDRNEDNSIQIHSESYHLTSGLNSISNEVNSQEYDSFILNPPSNNDIMEINKQLQFYQQQAKNLTARQKLTNRLNALSSLLFLQTFMLNVFIIFNYYYLWPKLDSLIDNDLYSLQSTDVSLFNQAFAFYFATGVLMIAYIRTSFTQPGSIPTFYRTKQMQDHELDRLLDSTYEFLLQFHSNNNAVLSGLNPGERSEYSHQKLQELIENMGDEETIIKYLLILDSVEFKSQRGMQGKPRYCKLCESYKPDRTHHCSICKCCVLKMDHHCPFINNCIGFYNYKYFMNMLIYCNVLLALIVFNAHSTIGSFIKTQFNYLSHSNAEHPPLHIFLNIFYLMTSYSFIALLSLVLFLFIIWHFQMIMRGLTTIEQREKISKMQNVTFYPFDVGVYRNWTSVFGNNPLLWFLPVNPNYKGYGLLYGSQVRSREILSAKLLKKVMENQSTQK